MNTLVYQVKVYNEYNCILPAKTKPQSGCVVKGDNSETGSIIRVDCDVVYDLVGEGQDISPCFLIADRS